MEIKAEGKKVLNFCANNYLGFADNKRVIMVLELLWNRSSKQQRR